MQQHAAAGAAVKGKVPMALLFKHAKCWSRPEGKGGDAMRLDRFHEAKYHATLMRRPARFVTLSNHASGGMARL
jgi:hypothetical protein